MKIILFILKKRKKPKSKNRIIQKEIMKASLMLIAALIVTIFSVNYAINMDYSLGDDSIIVSSIKNNNENSSSDPIFNELEEKQDIIKWMDFDVPDDVLKTALDHDIASYNENIHFNWIKLLSYGAAKNWGKFSKGNVSKDIDDVVARVKNGESFEEITENLKLYDFYFVRYSAVLGDFVGEYEVETSNPNYPNDVYFEKKYGLKVFSPIAKGYSYSHYKDFGVSRTYGYERRHQGNDLMGNIGTPIIAVEDGYVEAIGWNKYGGWRIGIRSFDKKRYYYYAHLKKDHPYSEKLEEGSLVQSGDVIGYLGMTGYSDKENTNNIKKPHLHFGLQIIFDESQKDGTNQIWLDVYSLVNFLSDYRMPVKKGEESSDYVRSLNISNFIID